MLSQTTVDTTSSPAIAHADSRLRGARGGAKLFDASGAAVSGTPGTGAATSGGFDALRNRASMSASEGRAPGLRLKHRRAISTRSGARAAGRDSDSYRSSAHEGGR